MSRATYNKGRRGSEANKCCGPFEGGSQRRTSVDCGPPARPAYILPPESPLPPPCTQAIPGVRPCGMGLNPATWMLEITALGPEQKLGIDFADVYAQSDLSR